MQFTLRKIGGHMAFSRSYLSWQPMVRFQWTLQISWSVCDMSGTKMLDGIFIKENDMGAWTQKCTDICQSGRFESW